VLNKAVHPVSDLYHSVQIRAFEFAKFCATLRGRANCPHWSNNDTLSAHLFSDVSISIFER